MRPIYIFDLDGTLANIEHRLQFITGEKKDWDSFFAACPADELIVETARVLKMLRKAGAEVWIWTGRSDAVKEETKAWLKKHGLLNNHSFDILRQPEELKMRKNGDFRPDHVIKFGWLAELEPPERRRIAACFEDRGRVVQMWREAGLLCYQVDAGEF